MKSVKEQVIRGNNAFLRSISSKVNIETQNICVDNLYMPLYNMIYRNLTVSIIHQL